MRTRDEVLRSPALARLLAGGAARRPEPLGPPQLATFAVRPRHAAQSLPSVDPGPRDAMLLGFMSLGVSRRRRSSSAVVVPRGVVHVTRQVHFNAAHRLHNPERSAAWNRATFGPCNNPRWHGHNYVLEVTVKGQPDPATGYVIDLGDLKRLLETEIVGPCDHRNLNEEVPWLRGVIPTTENLVICFWERLARRLPAGQLHCVRLYETPRNSAEYFGPDTDG